MLLADGQVLLSGVIWPKLARRVFKTTWDYLQIYNMMMLKINGSSRKESEKRRLEDENG